MRISESQQSALINSVEEFIDSNFSGSLKLFGSRADKQKKGGDIDLALIVNSDKTAVALKQIDYKIIASMKMKKEIGDQKIDFKILSKVDCEKAFFIEAFKQAVVLKEW